MGERQQHQLAELQRKLTQISAFAFILGAAVVAFSAVVLADWGGAREEAPRFLLTVGLAALGGGALVRREARRAGEVAVGTGCPVGAGATAAPMSEVRKTGTVVMFMIVYGCVAAGVLLALMLAPFPAVGGLAPGDIRIVAVVAWFLLAGQLLRLFGNRVNRVIGSEDRF